MAESCCICLEPPEKQRPLYRISCGCKVAQFHKPCENKWLETLNLNHTIKCFVCKREPVLKTNYSFSYETGENQKILWNSLGLFCIELPIAFYFKGNMLSLEGATIILFPFVFPSNKIHTFYLLHYILNVSLCAASIYVTNMKITANDLIFIRFFHLVLMFFTINIKNDVNPLSPYIISRELTYADVIYFSTKSAKPVDSKRIRRNKR